ncbi:MAG: tRNA-binding protein [Spirosomataceae bacterium]
MSIEFPTITWSDFSKIDLRVGTIVQADVFQQAKKPAYQITIDFGELGMKKSSAQLTALYQPEDLIGKQIVAVVNFPPKQIANFFSECLILGVVDGPKVTLLSPDAPVENGLRIG